MSRTGLSMMLPRHVKMVLHSGHTSGFCFLAFAFPQIGHIVMYSSKETERSPLSVLNPLSVITLFLSIISPRKDKNTSLRLLGLCQRCSGPGQDGEKGKEARERARMVGVVSESEEFEKSEKS